MLWLEWTLAPEELDDAEAVLEDDLRDEAEEDCLDEARDEALELPLLELPLLLEEDDLLL